MYEVEDRRKGSLACKVVTKQSLKTKKAKTKVSPVRQSWCWLYTDIAYSSMLKSKSIVH